MKKIIYTLAVLMTASLLTFAESHQNASQLHEAATSELEANRIGIALALYLKADSAYKAEGLTNTAEYAAALHGTGLAFFNNNQNTEGRYYTVQAMELREKLLGKVDKDYIISCNNYALSLLLDNMPEEALKYQLEVTELCRKINPPHPKEGEYIINLARIYHAMNDDVNAVKYLESALQKIEKFSTNYEYTLNLLGRIYMEKEDNANINRILGLMEEYNRHNLKKECDTPECHLEKAEYYMAIGDPAKAKEEYMTVFIMPLTDAQKATAYEAYARFLSSQQDFAQAGDYYTMASNTTEMTMGVCESSASLLYKAGLCFFLGKEYDKAIESHSKVIKCVDDNGGPEKLKSFSLQGLGNAYSAKREYVHSISTYRQWIQHLKTTGHEKDADMAKAYERLASAQKHNKDYESSIENYKTAISLYEDLEMYDEAKQAQSGLSLCLSYVGKETDIVKVDKYAQKQRQDTIRETLRSSLNLLEQGGDYLGKLTKAQILATIAEGYVFIKEYSKALNYYDLYINTIRAALAEDFLLKNPTERELTWRQELSTIIKMSALIAELFQESPELYSRLSNLIYEGQLLSKGILLSSNIEFNKVIGHYGTPEMKSDYDKIKTNLVAIERMRQEHEPLEDILKLNRETATMQLKLASQSATLGIYTDFLKYTSNDVANALEDDEAAVEFVTLDTGAIPNENMVVGVVISKEFPTGTVIPICEVRDLNAIIADKNKFANNGYTTLIWSDIMQHIPGKKKIYFAPDGVLNNIGIEYLTLDGKPMSEIIELSRLSSTREICRNHQTKPLKYAALFGNIDYMEDGLPASSKSKFTKRESDGLYFSNLEYTAQEISGIEVIVKDNNQSVQVLPYTGAKASKAEFISQEQMPINLLHIATHGMYLETDKATDIDAMNRSMLVFAGAGLHDSYENNGGIVTASEIAEMTLHDCDFVVLSACESGLGKLGSDGVFGLQRGFKNAGVQTLLVSLNEVSDMVTAEMMVAFYRNWLTAKMSKRVALQKAQSEIRSKYPDDDTWASFILIDSFDEDKIQDNKTTIDISYEDYLSKEAENSIPCFDLR